MIRLVVLDTSPLGLLAMSPGKRNPTAAQCVSWLDRMARIGTIVTVPEIARYELRRELIRAGLALGLDRLERYCRELAFSPIAGPVMDRASELWAGVRNKGLATADDKALDGDAILAAQALVEAEAGGWDEVIIATSNVDHLARFPGVDARKWQDIL